MNENSNEWTVTDLELFHDEELDASRTERLAHALRHDHQLRSRLADLRRLDDTVRAALHQPRPARRRVPTLYRAVPIAACLVLLAGITAWFTAIPAFHGHSHTPRRAAGAPEYDPIRIVFSIPVSTVRNRTAPAPAPGSRDTDFLTRLNEALAQGHLAEAMELTRDAKPDRRRLAYARLGEVLRSAQVAEMILDRLEPQEQLAVCRQWAAEPSLRPVVFTRLRRFAEVPAVSEQVASLVTDLSTTPALRTWLRSYQLVRPS